jgi:tetratricopeptide (TPR) repeat protein
MSDHSTAEVHFLRGMEAVSSADTILAATCFRQAIQDDPEYVDALFNLGKACKDLGKLDDAVDAFRRVVVIADTDVEAWYMLANTCYALEDYAAAMQSYRRVIQLTRHDIRAWLNLGITLHAAGQVNEALAVYDGALGAHPDNADLHYNRALALLSGGRFAEGWKEFEWRFYTTDRANPMPGSAIDRWDGNVAMDKTILIRAEQGIGDTVQFARFIPAVRRRCARVVVECQKELIPFLGTMPEIDVCVEREDASSPGYDVWTPLLSLPFLLKEVDHPSGSRVPYLGVDGGRRRRWQERLMAQASRPNVGIVWAGNPAHKNDHHRSCSADILTPLLRQAPVRWFSLCKSPGGPLPVDWEGVVYDLAPELKDFADTAAAIECLDLVITVDTAVAHVAGSLGKMVWLLLPFAPDWRWMRGTTESFWYPTMRIFRQARPGEWLPVIQEVGIALQALIPRNGAPHLPADTVGLSLEYANALREAGFGEHAILVYKEVVRGEPHNLAAWNNLGITLQDCGDLDGAISAFKAALAADPGHAVVMNNLGYALLEQGHMQEAESVLQRGILCDHRIPDLHNNLGNALRELGKHAEAETAYRQAIALHPGFAEAHWNLAQTLLQSGAMEEGWAEYDWRWHRPSFTSPRRGFPQPEWRGENIAGRRLLVHAEQGFGDAIQFVRYLPLIARQGVRVVLECQSELVRLFASVEGVEAILPFGSASPSFDVHIPMMSLPRVFRTTLETVPSHTPYVSVPPELREYWKQQLHLETGHLKVGVAWSGSRHLRTLLGRACPLEELFPLFTMRDIEFVSLQKGIADVDRALLCDHYGVRDAGSQVRDFADTAGVLQCLDLVISIDTSVAHLAGALNAPAWVLLPANADWRWLHRREDSPWYPSVRLFRQSSTGSWSEVVGEVCRALRSRRLENRP